MMITKKSIPRRTFLRGVGVGLALPLLDSMVPAFAGQAERAASTPRRFGVVYVPNGMMMKGWTPEGEGTAFEFSPILKALEPFRSQMTVISGLSSVPPPDGGNGGVHARAATRFLTDVVPAWSTGSKIRAGISLDQIIAREQGKHTQLASLEAALDSRDLAGSCDVGFSCAYTNTIAWRGDVTPLPMENNPRVLFERLFGDSGSTDSKVRRARLARKSSILDSVTESARSLQRGLGDADVTQLSEYLEAVRDVERRIQLAETESNSQLPVIEQAPGIPASYEEHAKLVFDLELLAFQTDITRVLTMMMARELSGRTYPEVGAPDAHHASSHHQDDQRNLNNLARINSLHVTLFSYFVDKLRQTPDGDGTLLDHTLLMYGAGMSDSNTHFPSNLPLVLLGGAAGLPHGRHLKYPMDTPLANLHLAIADKFGVPVDRMGDSTGPIDLLFLG